MMGWLGWFAHLFGCLGWHLVPSLHHFPHLVVQASPGLPLGNGDGLPCRLIGGCR